MLPFDQISPFGQMSVHLLILPKRVHHKTRLSNINVKYVSQSIANHFKQCHKIICTLK